MITVNFDNEKYCNECMRLCKVEKCKWKDDPLEAWNCFVVNRDCAQDEIELRVYLTVIINRLTHGE